ncbi:MAG: esterase-like activity of phytase family protein [Hyphomicrobiaceae bacterium]|nr:esterase-like activity of phytase family protein [Hyphomicrobiaceae bacterium]
MHRPLMDRRRVIAGLVASAAGALSPPSLARDEDADSSGLLTREEAITVTARPVPSFDTARPEARTFGALTYRGGLSLSSSLEHFGGLSGLVLEPDGSGLLAVTDAGCWLSADVSYDGNRPTGLVNARMGPLRGPDGAPLAQKKLQDAESLTLIEGTLGKGMVVVGFERNHRLVRYEVAGRRLPGPARGELKLPADARRMPKNQGFEAVAVLKGGRHKGAPIAFAERFTRGSGYHTGWIWAGGEPQRLQIKDIDVFDITDAAGLDNGDLLLLERRFRWTEGVQMRLRRLKGSDIVPGARLTGDILLQVNGDFQIDNMEGLAVHRDARGGQVVTLLSDDNFNHLLQRTLLLQFSLGDGRGATRT